MKKLICASIFMFCFSIFAFAQTNNSGCPEITVSGPHGLVKPGDTITFTANVKNANKSLKLEFEWSVSQEKFARTRNKSNLSCDNT